MTQELLPHVGDRTGHCIFCRREMGNQYAGPNGEVLIVNDITPCDRRNYMPRPARVTSQVFLVALKAQHTKNAILEAQDREYAKRYARHILGGDPDQYEVTPVTEPGSHTVFLLGNH